MLGLEVSDRGCLHTSFKAPGSHGGTVGQQTLHAAEPHISLASGFIHMLNANFELGPKVAKPGELCLHLDTEQ